MTLSRRSTRGNHNRAVDVLADRFDVTFLRDFKDAEWTDAGARYIVGAAGLPFRAPICEKIMSNALVSRLLAQNPNTDHLFIFDGETIVYRTTEGEIPLVAEAEQAVLECYRKIRDSRGEINDKGEQIIDLKAYSVGPHYAVNLLIGDRDGYPDPLFTTPKSAVDAFGSGSFRAGGATEVLATRYTLSPEENGEPANRQFYLVEDGKQIFYSRDVDRNVLRAECRHGRNHTGISYETGCGLRIKRLIFILPAEPGMPDAVEVQRVTVENRSGARRDLRIVFTGMFSLASPITTVNDVIFANIVHESELICDGSRPIALSLNSKPRNFTAEKRFAMILRDGEAMDDFCMSLPAFLGCGSLRDPELLSRLPSRMERKMAPFFAFGKAFSLDPSESADFLSFVGMSIRYDGADAGPKLEEDLRNLINQYSVPGAIEATYDQMLSGQERLAAYLCPKTGDDEFDRYVSMNLPFQVYYQTFVSRAFAWTQKAYRETGFREIQDIFASVYYLVAAGKAPLARDLISMWARNVYRMGYANHDFIRVGKEPGDCSDDPLWLVQAVYRYVILTGDRDFLNAEFPVADSDGDRSLWETLMSILIYCGRISVGAHGLPLLDKADWNDTLRLDNHCLKGPQKEAAYRAQLEKDGDAWGAPWKNTMSESCMNACLLKIAADEIRELSAGLGKAKDGETATEISERTRESMRNHAWKGDYYARALINDSREGGFTYLGAGEDGLSADPGINGSYFLNSFSWTILSDIADEEQIDRMLFQVERHLKTDAGLKLCTLVHYDLLGVNTATSIYFPGDRENGGVFKHAAMMAATAALRAARRVRDDVLARRLISLAYFTIEKVLPYRTLQTPYVTKGNPRFCTQYNNSETGENIGPILSGTASWLNLAIFEALGIGHEEGALRFSPVLREGQKNLSYRLNLNQDGTALAVDIESKEGAFRVGTGTRFMLDGKSCEARIPLPTDGAEHHLQIFL